MKRLRLSTLLLLVMIAALAIFLAVQGRKMAEIERKLEEVESSGVRLIRWNTGGGR